MADARPKAEGSARGHRVRRAMRAAVYYGRQDLRLTSVPEPEAGPGEVKLRVRYNGICGSDLLEYFDGPVTTRDTPHPLTGVKNPVIMGHELCGEVVALGAGIEDLAVGILVAVEPVETCGRCLYCGLGQYNHCPTLAIQGYNRPGGLAEYTVVARRTALTALGARTVLDPNACDVVAAIRDLTGGRGADASIDAAGGAKAFAAMLHGTRVDGTAVVVAIHHEPVVIPPFDLLMPEVRLTGVALSVNAFPAVIAEMARGSYPLEGWVETIPFDGVIEKVIERRRRKRGMKIVVDVAAAAGERRPGERA